jgi:pimeloyl-ACP methyl ester carboxylesterase
VTDQVVLVPGLWMPEVVMTLLAARLRRRGYAVRVFPYSGRRPHDANVERLARFAGEWANGRPAHFVGHSLGGVLILDMLNRHPEIAARSTVLLGAPVRGSFAGRRFGLAGVGRWMMGDCGVLWNERAVKWQREAPLGVIAGTAKVGLGVAFGPLPGPSDGVVSVSETVVEGMAVQVLVPLGHSVLIVSGRVAKMVARFLATGSFE